MTDTTETECEFHKKYDHDRLDAIVEQVKKCYDESVHREEVLGICTTVIDEYGNHIGTELDDDNDEDLPEFVKLVEMMGEDTDLWDYVTTWAGNFSDMDGGRNKRREEKLGWEKGKVVSGEQVSEAEVDRILEAIKTADLDCDCLKTA